MAYGDLARWMNEDSNRGRLENFLNEDRQFKTPFDLRKRGSLGTLSKQDMQETEKEITEDDLSRFYNHLREEISKKIASNKMTCEYHLVTTKEEFINRPPAKKGVIDLIMAPWNNKPSQFKKEFDEYLEKEKKRISQTNQIHVCWRSSKGFILENQLEICNKAFDNSLFIIDTYRRAPPSADKALSIFNLDGLFSPEVSYFYQQCNNRACEMLSILVQRERVKKLDCGQYLLHAR